MTIKYGEKAGQCGKVAAVNKDGTLLVFPSGDGSGETAGAALYLEPAGVEMLPAAKVDQATLKQLVRGEVSYSEFKKLVFPPFNIKVDGTYPLQADDISDALQNINQRPGYLQEFKEWFWIIQNVFYNNLEIEGRYDENVFSDAPETDDELFSTVYGLTERLYWKLEDRFVSREDTEKYIVKFDYELSWNEALSGTGPEEAAYKAVCADICSRVRTYMYNKDRPQEEWIFSASQKRHVVSLYEHDVDLQEASREERLLYKKFVTDLYQIGDVQAMKILAWSYYDGSPVFRQSYRKAEKYMQVLHQKTGDSQAANILGQIYYKGLASGGAPNYEKAFKYYTYGALAGIDESIYMSGEMLIEGRGTVKNIDMGMNLIVDGYRDTLFAFSDGEHDNRFAEYAYRMGNICRENLILGMGARDAYKFYLEADFAVRKRLKEHGGYRDDEEFLAQIGQALEAIKDNYHPDPNKSVLKADFPIYISHIFEDRFPVRVHVYMEKGAYYMKLARFRFMPGDESKLLVTFPELSYVNLVSELKFRLEETGVIKLPEKKGPFLSDGFTKNEHTGALEFYSGGELVAAIEAKWFVIDVTKEKRKQLLKKKLEERE